MKKLLFFIFLIAISSLIAVSAPYVLFLHTIENGISSNYLKLKKPINIRAKSFELSDIKAMSKEDSYFWRSFHFSNFNLPFPIRHPNYNVVPDIQIKGMDTLVGVKVLNIQKETIVKLKLSKKYTLKPFKLDDKIFSIPLVKNYILSKSNYDIWMDLYSYDFSVLNNKEWLSENIYKLELREMIYQLYLLKLREKYLGDNALDIMYSKVDNIVILGKKATTMMESGYRIENIMVWNNNQIWPIRLETLVNDKLSNNYRAYFFKNFSIKETQKGDAETLYAEFKSLPFKYKSQHIGMMYLYAGWTHDIENKKYLQEMIRFLERGKGNKEHILSLYNFAFEKYGTNFSSQDSNIKEDGKQRFKRLKEKEENDLNNYLRDISSEDLPDNSETLDYKLQKARNIDKNRTKRKKGTLNTQY